jgi:Protein of unknown function (DUF1499)
LAFRDARSAKQPVSLFNHLRAFPLNDVSTDVDDPPPLDAADGTAAGGPKMTALRRDKVRRGYPGLLGGLLLPLGPEEAFRRAETLARAQRGWEVRRVEKRERLLTAVAVTSLVRFRDDVTVRVRPAAGGSRVDMRSRSRLGKDDLGANAARIHRFLRELRAQQP